MITGATMMGRGVRFGRIVKVGPLPGMLKAIVFGVGGAFSEPLTSTCSWGLNEEIGNAPLAISIASLRESVVSGLFSSRVVLTVITASSARFSSDSTSRGNAKR